MELVRAVREVPDRPILEVEGEDRPWSVADLAGRAGALAARLVEEGVGRGDRVVVAGDATAVALGFFACTLARAVFVGLDRRWSESEVAGVVADCDPRAAVTGEAAPGYDALSRLPRCAPERGSSGAPAAFEPGRWSEAGLDEPVALVYTSGSTGRAKGVILSRRAMEESARRSGEHLGIGPGDRWYVCLPLHHVGGLSILVRSAVLGSVGVLGRPYEAGALVERLDAARASAVSLVPTMLERVVRAGERAPETLRVALVGGGATRPDLIAAATRLGWPVLTTYGLSEAASQVATMPPGARPAEPGAIGRPIAGIEVEIADPDERGVGEIRVAGPTLMTGYWNRPDLTARTIVGGRLRTGDLGRIDEKGYLHLEGRVDDVIRTGGEKVMPLEVEAALEAIPGVREACVQGVPDDEWGERVEAWIVVESELEEPAATDDALREALAGSLAGFKIPRAFHRVESLPRNRMGKVDRRAFRDP